MRKLPSSGRMSSHASGRTANGDGDGDDDVVWCGVVWFGLSGNYYRSYIGNMSANSYVGEIVNPCWLLRHDSLVKALVHGVYRHDREVADLKRQRYPH